MNEQEIRKIVEEMRKKVKEAEHFHTSVVDRVVFHNFTRRLEKALKGEK